VVVVLLVVVRQVVRQVALVPLVLVLVDWVLEL